MLYWLLLILASIGPGLIWLWFFYRLDRYEPEPPKLILKLFFAGILLVIPAGLLEQFWRPQLLLSIQNGNWVNSLVLAFVIVALIEEGLKTGFLWWIIGKNENLNEPVDGIIYGITLGLGFASLENMLWARIFGFGVAALRAVVTTLAHASFSGWAGHYIARFRTQGSDRPTLIWSGFLVAWVSHGLYDFFLFLRRPWASVFAFILIVSLLFRLYQVIQFQVAKSPFKKP